MHSSAFIFREGATSLVSADDKTGILKRGLRYKECPAVIQKDAHEASK